jgi:pimeloyl-ACP methyl ester carboxylesterase
MSDLRSPADNHLPAAVTSRFVDTARVRTHFLRAGPAARPPVVFVHGNVSSSRFFAERMAALSSRFHCLAPDLRGYGHTERAPIDATRGVRDFSDDLAAWLAAVDLEDAHFVGWSVGGGVVQQLAIDHPHTVRSLTLLAPMSPFGFGGTKDVAGTPTWPDHAGAGAGAANPDFIARLAANDRSDAHETSPRNMFRQFYVMPPFQPAPEVEDAYVEAMLHMALGEAHSPGDAAVSDNWPGVRPGVTGVNNAVSGQYVDLTGLVALDDKPPILWIRGADDRIVSDASLFELGHLGQMGLVPGWPGMAVFPPQPMIEQTRAVLEAYAEAGGAVREVAFERCGHGPHLEYPERFDALLIDHVQRVEQF